MFQLTGRAYNPATKGALKKLFSNKGYEVRYLGEGSFTGVLVDQISIKVAKHLASSILASFSKEEIQVSNF